MSLFKLVRFVFTICSHFSRPVRELKMYPNLQSSKYHVYYVTLDKISKYRKYESSDSRYLKILIFYIVKDLSLKIMYNF